MWMGAAAAAALGVTTAHLPTGAFLHPVLTDGYEASLKVS